MILSPATDRSIWSTPICSIASARDGTSPSLSGATRIRYGALGQEISTDDDITIELVPFRYVITTVDGDIVCAPYLPDALFAAGFE